MENNKIIFLVNHDIVIYNFRLELVERLVNDGYEVYISSPYGERIDELVKLGCKYLPIKIDRHGLNPLNEIRLLHYYRQIIRKVKPLVVLSYTIKPNIYGGLAAKALHIPFIANITGLGSAIENKGILQKLIIMIYKLSLNKVKHIFFQNNMNMHFFIKYKLVSDNYSLLPGSGVNLNKFNILPYPNTSLIEFVFISRIMKEKGIDEFLQAAKYITKKYSNVRFHICGFCEGAYEDILSEYENKGIIKYHGMIRDIREILKQTHCTILPSYFEGMSNTLLESAASGRPVITSNIPGCIETFDENISGYGIEPRNIEDLIKKIEKFLKLSNDQMRVMGENARLKMEQDFNRNKVIIEYMKQINNIEENYNENVREDN